VKVDEEMTYKDFLVIVVNRLRNYLRPLPTRGKRSCLTAYLHLFTFAHGQKWSITHFPARASRIIEAVDIVLWFLQHLRDTVLSRGLIIVH